MRQNLHEETSKVNSDTASTKTKNKDKRDLQGDISDSIVESPLPMDVLCGKDKSCVSHEGSVRFRRIIDQYRDRYCSDSTNKNTKMLITKEIYAKLVKSGARFLKYDSKRKVWRTISPLAARDKVSHALRFAHLKENLKTGKVKNVRRRVSMSSSASSSSNPKTPSAEDTELWNSFVSRQTKLLESIKKGENPDTIPAFVELPKKTNVCTVVLPEETSADFDPLSINDSSFEENPTFQDYCLQLYRSEGTNENEDPRTPASNWVVVEEEELGHAVSEREDLIGAFNDCDQGEYHNHYPGAVVTVDDGCDQGEYHNHYPGAVVTMDDSYSGGRCLSYEDQSEGTESPDVISQKSESDNLDDDMASMITEPIPLWDLEHDGIFEV